MADDPPLRNGSVARLDRAEQDIQTLFSGQSRMREQVITLIAEVRHLTDAIDEQTEHVAERLKAMQDDSTERRRLSSGEKIAVIGAIAVVFASVIGAIASLAAAGVFG